MSGRRGGPCRAWRACSHSWSQAAAGTEDRGQGRGDSPESTCPSRGFGEPSGKWTPGTPRCSATGWSTRSPHQACGGNRLVPPSPSSDRGSTQTRLRTRRYAASSEPTPHNHDHPSRRERQWGQHRTSGPAGVGRPPHHPTVGLRPDEPPASTARLPAEVLGEPGTREGPRENGQVGQPEGGPLLSCTALECRLGTK